MFEIAVDDAVFVCRFECIGYLAASPAPHQAGWDLDRFDPRAWTFNELQHKRTSASRIFDAVNGTNVWMIQRREHLRFALESREAISILCESRRQQLEGNVASKTRVMREIHLAHAAAAERSNDGVRAEMVAGQGHRRERPDYT